MDLNGANGYSIRSEAHYGSRVVRCYEHRAENLFHLVQNAAAAAPDDEALVFEQRRFTWRELRRISLNVAGGLSARGVSPGDRVALFAGNHWEFVVSVLATAALGAVLVPIGIREPKPALAYALTQSGASTLICDEDLLNRLPTSQEMPTLQVIVVGLSQDAAGIRFEEFLASAPLAAPVNTPEEAPMAILFTSGTTGRPKGAVLTHLGVLHSAKHYHWALQLSKSDRAIATVPLSHVTGMVAMIATMLHCQGTLIVMRAFNAAEFLDLACRERMSFTLMVPAMYALCLMQPGFDADRMMHWRVGGFGGAPMAEATIESLRARLPNLALFNVYGATETTSPATILPAESTRSHRSSVGQILPCVDVIVVDDDGREVPVGGQGELWISGPTVVPEYWGDAESTQANFTGGYWHSGDIGSIDADGFVYVHDRKKDMINRGGYKIFSFEVENALAQHEAVLESAVIGVPCSVLGERVHAFVSVKQAIDEASLRRHCAATLADYKVPERITLSHEPLPRNANGKLLKRVLRDQVAATT